MNLFFRFFSSSGKIPLVVLTGVGFGFGCGVVACHARVKSFQTLATILLLLILLLFPTICGRMDGTDEMHMGGMRESRIPICSVSFFLS